MSMKKKFHAVAQKLRALKDSGVKKITIFYTKDVGGKRVPNYLKIGLTAGVIALAAGGAYYYIKHKKHGHVLVKKKEHGPTPMPPQHEQEAPPM
jgi:hypothetical protein